MEIKVKNNNVIGAYKILTKKLKNDGFFRELRDREHFRSKPIKKREKQKHAVIRLKKAAAKQAKIHQKQEEVLVYRKPMR